MAVHAGTEAESARKLTRAAAPHMMVPDAVAFYTEHARRFAALRPWLGTFYQDYPNAAKLIALLDYWLYAYRCVATCFGIEGARRFCDSGFGSALRFAYLEEFGVDVNLRTNPVAGHLLGRLIAAGLDTAYLPGGRVTSPWSKIVSRLTKFVVMSVPVSVREARRQALVAKIVESSDRFDPSANGDWLATALPRVFSADPIDVFSSRELAVDASTVAFMDFCGYENLLLLNRPLRVLGRQHGGGYDMHDVDYFLKFEKALCDTFVGWGFSEVNARRPRYRKARLGATRRRDQRRLIWVERPLCSRLFVLMNPTLHAQQTESSVVEYVHEELVASGLPFANLIYPDPMQSRDYLPFRREALVSATGRGEDAIRRGDVAIFDMTGGTLLHYCIDDEITFVVVACPRDVEHFTDPAREWWSVLHRGRLAFYTHEVGSLRKRVIELMLGAEPPASVRSYHRERFAAIAAPRTTGT